MKEVQKSRNVISKPIVPETSSKKVFHESEKHFELQKAYNLASIENEKLEKQNRRLEEQRNNYIKLHREEKEKKNEFLDKYENLQKKHTEKIESFGQERLKLTKKYYSLLVLCVVALLMLVVMVFPNVMQQLSKN